MPPPPKVEAASSASGSFAGGHRPSAVTLPLPAIPPGYSQVSLPIKPLFPYENQEFGIDKEGYEILKAVRGRIASLSVADEVDLCEDSGVAIYRRSREVSASTDDQYNHEQGVISEIPNLSEADEAEVVITEPTAYGSLGGIGRAASIGAGSHASRTGTLTRDRARDHSASEASAEEIIVPQCGQPAILTPAMIVAEDSRVTELMRDHLRHHLALTQSYRSIWMRGILSTFSFSGAMLSSLPPIIAITGATAIPTAVAALGGCGLAVFASLGGCLANQTYHEYNQYQTIKNHPPATATLQEETPL